MSKTYIGERYSPLLMGAWNATTDYERLSIVTYDDKGYITTKDAPAGTLPTDANFYMLLYNNTINLGSITWDELTGKPATFPPTSHTQAWSTITSRPTEFPPSAHTHPIEQVNGLEVTIDDIQNDIETLKNASGSGTHIIEFYSDSLVIPNINVNTYTVKKWSNGYMEFDFWCQLLGLSATAQKGGIYYTGPAYSTTNIPITFTGPPLIYSSFNSARSTELCWTVMGGSPNPFNELPYLRIATPESISSVLGVLNVSMKGF